ncbi:hypothetical protein M752DRAFT_312372 [Aspergillus phoenicis ATCC 13157]|uniref:Uncharacterized protein n=1 Tax=Aspergillus phoenicis ATCC 13157 TaxID=1353007 RepID=A0A370P3I8_ASPPH|nr:hypothetical protein M752DRAFT_312372 [Aspergillus phoenicis ATCC 13157]
MEQWERTSWRIMDSSSPTDITPSKGNMIIFAYFLVCIIWDGLPANPLSDHQAICKHQQVPLSLAGLRGP